MSDRARRYARRVAFDWAGLTEHIRLAIVRAVSEFRDGHRDETIYGAAVFGFYAHGEIIAWPLIGVASEKSAQATDADLRWHPYDWDWSREPSDVDQRWSELLSKSARDGDDDHFDKVKARFYRSVIAACKSARKQLAAAGVIDKTCLVVAVDEAEELVAKCISKAQLRRHFPHLDAAQVERDRIAGLPVTEQVREWCDLLIADATSSDAPLGWEESREALIALGRAEPDLALDAIMSRVRETTDVPEWRWMFVIDRIRISRPDVVEYLTSRMRTARGDESASRWSAGPLVTLGHTDIVVTQFDSLNPGAYDVFGGPYRALDPDHPLDYRPLEAALTAHPEIERALVSVMGTGVTRHHDVPVGDVAALFDGLRSPWAIIRRHAAFTLLHAPLDGAGRQRFLDSLAELENDPDPEITAQVPLLRSIFADRRT